MNTKEKLSLAALLARRCDAAPSFVAGSVSRIARAAAALTRLAEKACNEPVDDAEQHRAELLALRTIMVALGEMGIHNVSLEFNGDPRGFAVFMLFGGEDPVKYSNSWDIKRGYGIG